MVKFCRKFPKPFISNQTSRKTYCTSFSLNSTAFNHVSDNIPVVSFTVNFVRALLNYASSKKPSSSDCRALLFLPTYFRLSCSTVTSMSPPSTRGLFTVTCNAKFQPIPSVKFFAALFIRIRTSDEKNSDDSFEGFPGVTKSFTINSFNEKSVEKNHF